MSESAEEIHFRPFTVLLGIVMGTLFSIAFGLLIVSLIFWILRDEEPRLAAEYGSLMVSTGIFTVLSSCAGLSFFGSLKQAVWRHVPMVCLWVGLLLAGRYYWP
jgi:hypothetical protein